MDRRGFLTGTIGAAAGLTMSEQADALEHAMSKELDKNIRTPWMCDVDTVGERIRTGLGEEPAVPKDGRLVLQGEDPRLPKMPAAPTLIDFYKYRLAPASHLLQSANLAMKHGMPEKVIVACLLHDIANSVMLRTDHGYWAAQMIEPYVDPEVTWAIRAHQALRFFPDLAAGYAYPESYVKLFGADYKPEPYIVEAYEKARKHKWYMTSRLITVNDLYAFDPNVKVSLDQFTDVIHRNFKQPKEGLGFDGSPVAHMWRSIIWPNNFL
jgi:hypothetical protein